MATFTSHSPEETVRLGETWGRTYRTGSVIALQGDLGAGKTQLVKGIALGLGISDRVVSPTFALINTYSSGPLPLFHLDLYRLEGRADVLGAGLEEMLFRPAGVTVVEWPERWLSPEEGNRRPPTWIWIRIEAPDESIRLFHYDSPGT